MWRPLLSALLVISFLSAERPLKAQIGPDNPYEAGMEARKSSRRITPGRVDRLAKGTPAPPASKTAGWITLLSDGFESEFPGGWEVFRLLPSKETFWSPANLRPHTGANSLWPAAAGPDNGLPSGTYPDSVATWIQFGPFNLATAGQARLRFYRWIETAPGDSLFWGVSTDGELFDGFTLGGSLTSWQEEALDLQAELGESQVWIAFVFESNGDGLNGRGVFLDDVLLELNDDPPVPNAPLLLAPADGETDVATTLRFDWADSGGAESYRLQVAAEPSFAAPLIDEAGLALSEFTAVDLPRAASLHWRVSASNVSGTGPWSEVRRFTTLPQPPPAPALISPEDEASGLTQPIQLDWDDASGANSYELQVSTTGGFAALEVAEDGLEQSTYSVSGLPAGTAYYWRVRASNAGGSGPWSIVRRFTTLPDPPQAPSLVSPADNAADQALNVTLDWADLGSGVTYVVEVSESEAFGTTILREEGLATSQLAVGDLVAETTYYWRVRGVNAAGPGPWSSVRRFTTAAANTLTAPSLTSPPNGAVNVARTPVLSWNAVGEATGYQVQIASASSFETLVVNATNLTNTTYTPAELQAGMELFWRVRALADDATSPWSEVWSFTTLPEVPGAPELVSPADGAANQPLTLVLQWSDVAQATSYAADISADETFDTSVRSEEGLTSSEMAVAGLGEGKTYFWRARAMNAAGSGPWSAVRRFGTRPPLPAIPQPISPADGANNVERPVDMDWTDVAGAETYRLQVAVDDGFGTRSVDRGSISTSSFSAAGLSAGVGYFWRVRAENATGSGAWSAARHFSTRPNAPAAPVLMQPLNGSRDLTAPVRLTWQPATGADSYDVQVATDASMTSPIAGVSGTTETAYTLEEVNPGATLFWRVRASNVSGDGPWSNAWSFSTLPELPEVPILSSPTDGSVDQPTSVTLDWGECARAQSYRVQVSQDASLAPAILDTSLVGPSQLSINGLVSGATYYWRVRGSNTAGVSDWSEVWQFATAEATVLATPSPVRPVNGSTDAVRPVVLEWGAVDGALRFEVEVSEQEDFSTLAATKEVEQAVRVEIDGLAASTAYYWHVRALNGGGPSAWSTTWTFTTAPDPPGAASLLSPANDSENVPLVVSFEWTSVETASAYRLQLSTSDQFAGDVIVDAAGVASASYTVSDLPASAALYWRVRASNASGSGAWSEVWSFSTTGAVPAVPRLLSPANGAENVELPVQLVWSENDDASMYAIQVSERSDFVDLLLDEPAATENAYRLEGPGPGLTLYWRVQAMGEAGVSAWSPAFRFTTAGASVAAEEEAPVLPVETTLASVYPNPFADLATLWIESAQNGRARIRLYDMLGRPAAEIFDGVLDAGSHRIRWRSAEIPAGSYLVVMEMAGRRYTKLIAHVP